VSFERIVDALTEEVRTRALEQTSFGS
jgi:hypothetical protein